MKLFSVKKSFSGLGLFANVDIKAGTYLTYYKGKRLTAKQAELHTGKYLFELSKNITIDGAQRDNIARYFNHSCKPNVDSIRTNRIRFYASKYIKAGDELNINYGKEYVDCFIKKCLCGKCNRR